MIKRNKKALSLFLSLALVLGIFLGFAPQTAFAAESTSLTILHVNDVHGRVEYASPEENDPSIGFAKMKTKVDEWRAEKPNLLLLNAGDTLHGTVDINLSEGKSMIDLMNLMGFDAMVPGNHDFNYGYQRLLELKGLADFPIVAANIEKDDGSEDFDGYTIKEMDGIKVGIFGIATEETKHKSHPDNTKGIEFGDYLQASNKMVEKLREEDVDIIVALVHVGVDGETEVTARDIARLVDGLDVVIDGHSHTELPQGELIGNTLLAQAGYHGKNIGVVELEIKDKEVMKKSASLYGVEEVADVKEDAEIKAAIDVIKEKNDIVKKEIIGKTTVDLVGERDVVRAGESTLGNVITDAMLKATGADVALTNGGGIRASIEKGDITLGDAMTSFPFTNFLSTIEVKGQDIMDAIEFGVDAYPDTAGKFPHVAGMKYVFNPTKPAGQRVASITIGEEPIDLEKTYTLVSNDFVATGGDGYTMFDGKKIVAEGALLSDVLIAYLKDAGEISPQIEGRIVASKDAQPTVGDKPAEEPVEKPEEVKPEPKPEPKPEVKPEKPVTVKEYRVKKGDTLWGIGREYKTTWQRLADFNKIKNPNLIYPNQIIMIK